jgi:putative ABC transport system permease protein
VVTVVAAVVPALRASRIPPIAALREVAAPPRSLRSRVAAGTAVTAIGLSLVLLGLLLEVSNAIALVGVGALITFVGVSMLAPLVARKFAAVAGAPLARYLGVVGQLARENAIRRPRRTAATASALMIGVALVSVIAVFQASAKAAVADAFREDFATDFQVRLSGFGDPRASGLSSSLAPELRQVEGVEVVVRDRMGEYRAGPDGVEKFLLGVDGPLDLVAALEMREGEVADLGPGTALLSVEEANSFMVGAGDSFQIQLPSGRFVDLTVAGIFEESPIGVPLIVDLATFEENIDFNLDRFIYILLEEGADPEAVRPAIEQVTDRYPNAALTNTEELIADIEEQIDGLLNLLVVLLGFALIIALLGIINTLALSISERRREIGLLRAVGMQRRQVRRMIRWEAVLIAVFGGLLGLLVGVVLGSAIVLSVGQGLTLAIPWTQLAIYVLLAGIGGVIAAIVPARRGARMDILEAIAYE